MEKLRSHIGDLSIGAWVLLAGAAFIVPLVWSFEWPELELVGRYVYLGVVTGGIIGLALRAARMVRR